MKESAVTVWLQVPFLGEALLLAPERKSSFTFWPDAIWRRPGRYL